MLKKILIVSSKNAHIQSLKDDLQNSFDIEEADSCLEASKYLRTMYRLTKLVLVSMDIFRQDDYCMITQMQTNVVLEAIPVICLGDQYGDEQERIAAKREAFGKGVISFFSVPYDLHTICSLIRNLIKLKDNASLSNQTISRDATRNYDKHLANGTFWNPNSLDNLIMRTYVGAACILESMEEHISIIRANNRCSQELLGRIAPMEKILSANLERHMDSRNRTLLIQTMNMAAEDDEEASCELRLHDLREDEPVMHIRLAIKLIDQVKNRRLFYCTFQNDTRQFEAQSREISLMAQLKIILQNFSGGITAAYVQNGKINYVYTNDEFYSMFGYTKEQFDTELSGNFFSMILPEYLPEVREGLHRSVRTGETAQVEYQARKRDGTVIWVNGRNTFCRLERVDNPVFITIYEDISINKQAEERIRTINDRLGNSEIFIQFEVTGRILEDYHSIYEPEKSIREAGTDEKDIEKFILDTVYERDRRRVARDLSFRNLIRFYTDGETKSSIEYRRYMPSGEIRWFCAAVVLLDGMVSGTVNALIYCHDIDDKMKQRIATRKVAATAVDDIMIIHIGSNISNIYRLHTGSSLELGKSDYSGNIRSYIDTEVAEEDKRRCETLFSVEHMTTEINKKGECDFSYWEVRKDGRNYRKNTKVVYLDSTQEDLLMTGRDITVLFKKEQERQVTLQHAAELANAANRAKSDFLSRMSHDMRTPLNAILGLTELAKQKYNNPEMMEYVNSIDISGQYLLGLINDTLDLSKIESGKMELHEEAYPLDEFILGLNTVIKPLMTAKNIDFIMKLENEADNIVVDKLRFTQIFYNLLSNAAKYTPAGGRVEFSSEKIQPKGGKFGMRFHVCDNGIGMSDEYQKILFDPFTQENRPAHSEQKGTGLGLAIVKRIVDLTGGTINVISEVNQGTEFIVDLYAHNQSRRKKKKEVIEYDINRLVGARVLLVDDTEINAMITERTLQDKGCRVDVAVNGAEAVQKFAASEQGYYDVIVTDVRMPVMDGLEEARQIRAMDRPDAGKIPIIGATADAYTEDQDLTTAAGMNARLVKPIQPQLLYDTILRLMMQT